MVWILDMGRGRAYKSLDRIGVGSQARESLERFGMGTKTHEIPQRGRFCRNRVKVG